MPLEVCPSDANFVLFRPVERTRKTCGRRLCPARCSSATSRATSVWRVLAGHCRYRGGTTILGGARLGTGLSGSRPQGGVPGASLSGASQYRCHVRGLRGERRRNDPRCLDGPQGSGAPRRGAVHRGTGESDVTVELCLDGSGIAEVSTACPFSTTCSPSWRATARSISSYGRWATSRWMRITRWRTPDLPRGGASGGARRQGGDPPLRVGLRYRSTRRSSTSRSTARGGPTCRYDVETSPTACRSAPRRSTRS